jgi:energy-coupling factor transport system permease protein
MHTTFINKLSAQRLKQEILHATYGNRDIFLAQIDARIMLTWYLIFAVSPWFFYDRVVLVGFVCIVLVTALLAKISRLLLFLLCFGLASDMLGWIITSFFFGGNLGIFWALSPLFLKLVIVSLASLTIFSSLDPDKFADALYVLRVPEQIVFSVSYAYRMLPMLVSEYTNIVMALRARIPAPQKDRWYWFRQLYYYLSLLQRAFYPMMLNTAIRTRLIVECLELRGFTYALQHDTTRQLRIQHLRIRPQDISFLSISILLWFVVLQIGRLTSAGGSL